VDKRTVPWGVKRPDGQVNNSLSYSSKVKNVEATVHPSCFFVEWYSIKGRDGLRRRAMNIKCPCRLSKYNLAIQIFVDV
jgi:hypothetical protein